jgi:2-oxo-3-hexenedioate decarboxylase
MNLNQLATTLREARENRQAIAPLTATEPLTLEQAYAVQEIGRELALAGGETVCGYKMGLTSRAKQRDVQVFETIHGYLLRSMEVLPGQTVATATRIHPRVEPEVAVVLKRPLRGRVSLRELVSAIEGIYPALEILDSRYESFSFRLPDVIADNTSASGFAVGSRNLLPYLDELTLLGVSMRKNGELLETGTPAAAMGNPLFVVIDLLQCLARENRQLEPGMVVLTGGLTASVPFAKGDWIEIEWPGETLAFHAE